MNEIKQRVYEFGRVVNGMVITDKTHIENAYNAKVVPITFENTIVGVCTIDTDNEGIVCDGVINDDMNVDNEMRVGILFINKHHSDDNGINVLDDISIANITTK
jgi:hypothetical protein